MKLDVLEQAIENEEVEADEQQAVDVIEDIDLSVTHKKRFRIDGDSSKIIELNTSDMGIVMRLQEVYPKLTKLAEDAAANIEVDDEGHTDLETSAKVLKKIDEKMREYMDYLFDSSISEKCVDGGTMWDPFNGKFRFEHIIERLAKLYGDNFRKEFNGLSRRMKKHTAKYTK